MSYRTRFSERVRTSISFNPAERRTKSEFKSECDINAIMARYIRTGELPESARMAAARFADVSETPSFMEMQDKILAANAMFAALPAAVRKQFDNDAAKFVAASETDEGVELLKRFGLGKEEVSSPSKASPAPAAGVAAPEAPEAPEAKPAEPSPTKKGK